MPSLSVKDRARLFGGLAAAKSKNNDVPQTRKLESKSVSTAPLATENSTKSTALRQSTYQCTTPRSNMYSLPYQRKDHRVSHEGSAVFCGGSSYSQIQKFESPASVSGPSSTACSPASRNGIEWPKDDTIPAPRTVVETKESPSCFKRDVDDKTDHLSKLVVLNTSPSRLNFQVQIPSRQTKQSNDHSPLKSQQNKKGHEPSSFAHKIARSRKTENNPSTVSPIDETMVIASLCEKRSVVESSSEDLSANRSFVSDSENKAPETMVMDIEKGSGHCESKDGSDPDYLSKPVVLPNSLSSSSFPKQNPSCQIKPTDDHTPLNSLQNAKDNKQSSSANKVTSPRQTDTDPLPQSMTEERDCQPKPSNDTSPLKKVKNSDDHEQRSSAHKMSRSRQTRTHSLPVCTKNKQNIVPLETKQHSAVKETLDDRVVVESSPETAHKMSRFRQTRTHSLPLCTKNKKYIGPLGPKQQRTVKESLEERRVVESSPETAHKMSSSRQTRTHSLPICTKNKKYSVPLEINQQRTVKETLEDRRVVESSPETLSTNPSIVIDIETKAPPASTSSANPKSSRVTRLRRAKRAPSPAPTTPTETMLKNSLVASKKVIKEGRSDIGSSNSSSRSSLSIKEQSGNDPRAAKLALGTNRALKNSLGAAKTEMSTFDNSIVGLEKVTKEVGNHMDSSNASSRSSLSNKEQRGIDARAAKMASGTKRALRNSLGAAKNEKITLENSRVGLETLMTEEKNNIGPSNTPSRSSLSNNTEQSVIDLRAAKIGSPTIPAFRAEDSSSKFLSADRSFVSDREEKLPGRKSSAKPKSSPVMMVARTKRDQSPAPQTVANTMLKNSLPVAKTEMKKERGNAVSFNLSSSESNEERSETASRASKVPSGAKGELPVKDASLEGLVTKGSFVSDSQSKTPDDLPKPKSSRVNRLMRSKRGQSPAPKIASETMVKDSLVATKHSNETSTNSSGTKNEFPEDDKRPGIGGMRTISMISHHDFPPAVLNAAKKTNSVDARNTATRVTEKGAKASHIRKKSFAQSDANRNAGSDPSKGRGMIHSALADQTTPLPKARISSADIMYSFRQFNNLKNIAANSSEDRDAAQNKTPADPGRTSIKSKPFTGFYLPVVQTIPESEGTVRGSPHKKAKEQPGGISRNDWLSTESDDNSLASQSSFLEQEVTMHSMKHYDTMHSSVQHDESIRSMTGRDCSDGFFEVGRLYVASKSRVSDAYLSTPSSNTISNQSFMSESIVSSVHGLTGKTNKNEKWSDLLQSTPENCNQMMQSDMLLGLSSGPSNRSARSFANSIESGSPSSDDPSSPEFDADFDDFFNKALFDPSDSKSQESDKNSAELFAEAADAAVCDVMHVTTRHDSRSEDDLHRNEFRTIEPPNETIEPNLIIKPTKRIVLSKSVSISPSRPGRSDSPPADFIFNHDEEIDLIIRPDQAASAGQRQRRLTSGWAHVAKWWR